MGWLEFRTILGFGPSRRLAECTRCHTATTPGGSECPTCQAAFPENRVIRTLTAVDVPDEYVEGFVSCPGCGRLLRPGVEACPECGAAITREYAERSVEANVTVGQAYGVAQRIESFNPIALIVLALALWSAFARSPAYIVMLSVMSAWPLVTIARWFRWFGPYESDDEEFAAARRKVKGALRIWLGALCAVAAALAASLWLR